MGRQRLGRGTEKALQLVMFYNLGLGEDHRSEFTLLKNRSALLLGFVDFSVYMIHCKQKVYQKNPMPTRC